MKQNLIFLFGLVLFITIMNTGCAPRLLGPPVEKLGPGWQPVGEPRPYVPPSFVRITMDSVYAHHESRGLDRLTFSDEPYLVVTGFASHKDPIAWSTGDPQVFGDMDTNENRRITEAQRVVFEDYVPVSASIGFSVLAMENDDWSTKTDPGDSVSALAARASSEINEEFISISPNENYATLLTHLTAAARRAYEAIKDSGPWESGPADDWVAHSIAVSSYDQLGRLAQNGPVSGFRYIDLDGKDEGRYWLRWHVEFEENASNLFDARFTHWDELVVADIMGGPEAEIITYCDEDAAGNRGLARVYNHAGQLIDTFTTLFTPYDRVAIGNVRGSPDPEIVVAFDQHGGGIQIFSPTAVTISEPQFGFDAPFTKYDGMAVGNVLGDDTSEILIARDDDKKVYIYDGRGNEVSQFSLHWNFNGTRYTNKNTRHDAFLVGDVIGDDYADIVMIDNKNGWDSRVYVYNSAGDLVRISTFTVFFTRYDAATLADITGDDKKELIIASDGGDGPWGYWINVYDIATGQRIFTRSWPLFTKYDGFAAGDVFGNGKEQIVLSTDQNDRIYISK